MHAHDRTLLASLGFADPDKRDKRHGLACQYICGEDVAGKFVERFALSLLRWSYGRNYSDGNRVSMRFHRTDVDDARLVKDGDGVAFYPSRPAKALIEVAIQKGEGKYSTTVGFADVAIRAAFTMARVEDGVLESGYRQQFHVRLIVEVKCGRVEVGEIARQLELYRTYGEGNSSLGATAYVAALMWDLHPDERRALEDKGFAVARLGPAFESYCAQRSDTPAEPSPGFEV